MAESSQNNNFVKLVAYFLAEIVRSRRASISRAAEISEEVVKNLSQFSSEAAALNWVQEISREFEELGDLKQALKFNYHPSDIGVYQDEVKDFASRLLERDMRRSSEFLNDASAKQNTIQQLCIKYPDFCNFLLNSDKAKLLPQMTPAVS